MSKMKTNFGFVRVTLCRPKLVVANVSHNVEKICDVISKHPLNTQFICFPELAFSGYTCADLFHEQFLLEECLNSLKSVEAQSIKFPNIVIIVGLPFQYNGMIFNVAAVFNGGKLLALIPKSYLPNYDEFKEKIYFQPAFEKTFEIRVRNFSYPVVFGNQVFFNNTENQNISFGVEICEDLWAVEPPSGKLALHGAIIIFNLSASNDLIGKSEFRERLIRQQSERLISAYCYVSSGLGESTSELVFSGYGSIYEDGKLLGEIEKYSLDTTILTCDIDTDLLLNERIRNTVWGDSVNKLKKKYLNLHFSLSNLDLLNSNLLRKINPYPFIPDFPSTNLNSERYQDIVSIQANALAMRFLRSKAKKFVIGVSGGLDSTLALLVSIESCRILDISTKNILAITMPGFGTSDITKSTISKLCSKLNVEFEVISILDSLKQHFIDIDHNGNFDVTFENAQARERTQILFDKANQLNGIVIGTGDLSEIALGWSTFNGDQMSSYNVNSSIPKTLVKMLINWFAEFKKEYKDLKNLFYDILSLPISPELLPNENVKAITHKTEDIIGPFELHDFFLYYFIRFRFEPKKILFLANIAFEKKYSEEEIKKYLNIFVQRFFSNQFKRSSMPEGPKVGLVSLSPRSDWRIPGDLSSNSWMI